MVCKRFYGEDSIGGDIATQVGADLVAKSSGKLVMRI